MTWSDISCAFSIGGQYKASFYSLGCFCDCDRPQGDQARLDPVGKVYPDRIEPDKNCGGARNSRIVQAGWSGLGEASTSFEQGENRSDTGDGPKVVRVGTHALTAGSGTKLWTRLSEHKGPPKTGGGNHRGSIFRLIVGAALINRESSIFRHGITDMRLTDEEWRTCPGAPSQPGHRKHVVLVARD